MFIKHDFKPKVRLQHGVPSILLSEDAYKDMAALVDLIDMEIGWLGSAFKLVKSNAYYIDKIFLPKQQVHHTTTEISEEGVADMTMEILAEFPDEEGMEIVNSIRFWGHSHVNMETNPSNQDDRQMDAFIATCDDFFIRGIMNKKGKASFTIYDIENELIYEDVSWTVHYLHDECIEKWRQQIKDKVTMIAYQPYTAGKKGKKHKNNSEFNNFLRAGDVKDGKGNDILDEEDYQAHVERMNDPMYFYNGDGARSLINRNDEFNDDGTGTRNSSYWDRWDRWENGDWD